MNLHNGMRATGIAQAHLKTLFVVADTSEALKPSFRHELMHLIAMLGWGYPHYSLTWLNAGLANCAENNCNGYNLAQIYTYFLAKDMLFSVDSLTNNFYKQAEMIG